MMDIGMLFNPVFFLIVFSFFIIAILTGYIVVISRARERDRITRPDHESFVRTSEILLKELIAYEYPQLKDRQVNDWDKVSILRQWARRHTPIASPDFTLLLDYNTDEGYDTSFKFYTKTAPEIFAAFFSIKGGVYCGGTAYALSKLYEMFGYESFTVNMGFPEGTAKTTLTHVTTLVTITHNNHPILSVQDGFFNQTFMDEHDNPIDYFEMLNLLSTRQTGRLKIIKGDSTASLLARKNDEDRLKKFFVDVDLGTPPARAGDLLIYKADSVQEKLDDYFRDALIEKLHPRGYPDNSIFLYVFPFSISGTNTKKANELMERAKSLLV